MNALAALLDKSSLLMPDEPQKADDVEDDIPTTSSVPDIGVPDFPRRSMLISTPPEPKAPRRSMKFGFLDVSDDEHVPPTRALLIPKLPPVADLDVSSKVPDPEVTTTLTSENTSVYVAPSDAETMHYDEDGCLNVSALTPHSKSRKAVVYS